MLYLSVIISLAPALKIKLNSFLCWHKPINPIDSMNFYFVIQTRAVLRLKEGTNNYAKENKTGTCGHHINGLPFLFNAHSPCTF